MYSELEKVRNMLVTQYDINKEMGKEVAYNKWVITSVQKDRLNQELEQQSDRYEFELNELKTQIVKYKREIEVLENQLRAISGGVKLDGTLMVSDYNKLTVFIKDVTSTQPTDSDITLRFARLLVTEEGLKLTNTATPSIFFLIEFFDFEFQITPLVEGPE
jgi:chaperonin cofactor prefoldin